ncbi:MAG: hypothetical protein IJD77_06865 [Clostridia bacterium]|nr:hypothetical protein [Clostridia bacterium]
MDKNIILENTQDSENEYSPCIYQGECVEINGRRYPVLSVIPIKSNRKDIVPDTASDKIKYLISGGKH